jgi:hypothetical protein
MSHGIYRIKLYQIGVKTNINNFVWLSPNICETVGATSNLLFTPERINTKKFNGKTAYKLDI